MRSLSTNRLNSTNKGQASTGLSFFQAQAISKERKHTKTTTTATATTIRGDRLFSQTHFVTEYAGNTHSPQLNNPQQHHYLTDRFLGKTEQTQAFGVVGAATSQSRNNNNIFISTRTSQGTLEQPLQNQQLQDIVTMNAVAKAQIKLARELEQQNQQTIRHLNRRTMNFTLFKQLVLSSFSVLNKKLAKTHSIAKKNGLANSLYFELAPQGELFSRRVEKPSAIASKSLLQERKSRSVLYDTIKSMVLSRIRAQEVENTETRQYFVPFEQFRQFSPAQLLTIISMKPQLLDEMLSAIGLKEKTLNFIMLKLKHLTERTGYKANYLDEEDEDEAQGEELH